MILLPSDVEISAGPAALIRRCSSRISLVWLRRNAREDYALQLAGFVDAASFRRNEQLRAMSVAERE